MKTQPDTLRKFFRQRGSTLIVSLLMLLLLTLVGVAGMKDTLLQEKMVGNVLDREIALQAAESALRAAEDALDNPLALTMTNSGGLYDTMEPANASLLMRTGTENAFWSGWAWTANSVAYPATLDGVLNPPRYVIEQLDPALSDRSSYPAAAAGIVTDTGFGEVKEVATVLPDYRVTAWGVGRSADAVVILQATFRRDQ